MKRRYALASALLLATLLAGCAPRPDNDDDHPVSTETPGPTPNPTSTPYEIPTVGPTSAATSAPSNSQAVRRIPTSAIAQSLRGFVGARQFGTLGDVLFTSDGKMWVAIRPLSNACRERKIGTTFDPVWSFTQRTISVDGKVLTPTILHYRTGYVQAEDAERLSDLTAHLMDDGVMFSDEQGWKKSG